MKRITNSFARYEVVFDRGRVYPFNGREAAIAFGEFWQCEVYDTVEDKIIFMP